MNQTRNRIVADEAVFLTASRRSLADVLAACEAEMEGAPLRDARSAFRFFADRVGIDLAATLARPADLREIFAALNHATLGVSEKRLANIRSLIASAVDRFGMRRTFVTREIPLDANWTALLDRIGEREHRWALSRLAAYCTVKGIPPQAVTPETLVGLYAALEAEAVSKKPQKILKHVIAVWNMCDKRVPDWPGGKLSSPFKTEPYMLQLEAFPESFQRDVAAFEARMRNPDPLDPAAPVRAMRPDTIKSYLYTFRRMASALVRSGVVPLEGITGFAVLIDEHNFKEALRPFVAKAKDGETGHAHKMATQMINVAKNQCGIDEARLKPLRDIARRIAPKNAGVMGMRNRERLQQFDDDAAVRRLLRFPAEERARALQLGNPLRRAKGIERALAISLLIFTGLRVKNLRQLQIDGSFRRVDGRFFLRVGADETKTPAELELELPGETIELYDEFIRDHRPLLPGAGGPYLFPGETGGPRSYSAIRDAVAESIRKHAGIHLSPHLFRHIVAKLVAERCPEHLHDVSRMLGHKSMRTTFASYLGTEGPAASRRLASILRKAAHDDRSHG
jgi:integrase